MPTKKINAVKASMFVTIMLLCALCLNSGCCSGGQNSVAPLSWSGSGEGTAGGNVVKGAVVDCDSLEPLSNASVSIGTLKTTTDAQGNYTLTGVPAGQQTIEATCREYSDDREQVMVSEGQEATQDITMETAIDDWLEQDQAYNWQVEAVQADGTLVPGPVWSFSTGAARSVRPLSVPQGIDGDTARKVAETFLASHGPKYCAIISVEPISGIGGVTLAYAFRLSPAGYVIVPACSADVLPPVLAYSFTSPFSTHSASSLALVKMIRSDITLRLSALQQKATIPPSLSQKNRALWESSLSGKWAAETGRAVYGPLLTDPTWGQRSPYNKLCPMDPETEVQCITGCVATAYSQVLNYWKVPTAITFTAADNYTTKTREIAITASSASFSGLNYNNGTPDGDTKAKLCFALGVAAKMNYTSKNSTAYTLQVGKTMTRFGYNEPKTISFGVNDTLDTSYLVNDLKASTGHPVVMAISEVNDQGNFSGGHCIVCDGYNDSTGTFHLNMGWNSSQDGWYSLPGGMPSDYTNVKGYVYNMTPASKGTAAQKAARAVTPENPYPENGETRVAVDDELLWDECDNAVSYHCYLWKSGSQKPAVPTFSNLPCGAASPANL
ncbi:MAG: C10 family peptidase [Candidatus Eremiobacteraeota bacterium]|nr:C10 family peptidase [Candidatus Eremiobacteraeota bacterium]